MKAKLSGLSLGIALAMGAAGPALAGGDVIYQGYKDPAAAIPVPAPIPIEEYAAEYYIRFDVGGSWPGSGTIGETGTALEIQDIGELEATEWGSIGAGRYVTPSIRVELAVDLSTRTDLAKPNVSYYTDTRQAAGPDFDNGVTTVSTVDTKFYSVSRREKIQLEQDLGMVNAYYDIRNSSRFTPYVGAGLGVSYRQLHRKATESAQCSDTVNSEPGQDATYATPQCVSSTDLPNSFETTSETTKSRWDIAAAATVGVAYEITDDILWDTSYRYLWTSGGLHSEMTSVGGTSVVDVEDIGQHQVRTGIRLNLN